MMPTLTEQLTQLASEIDASNARARSELTLFPSGGAMLDVHREDGRVFVLSFSPLHGFGVDEVRADDGFIASYSFTFSEFEPAGHKLQELVFDAASRATDLHFQPKLSLIVVYARNLEATREFYAALGITFQDEQHGNGPRHYAATLGGAVFEIYPLRDDEPIGGLRLGFGVESVDRTVQSLRQRQVKIVTEPRDSPWGRRAVVADPNGNRVELTQQP